MPVDEPRKNRRTSGVAGFRDPFPPALHPVPQVHPRRSIGLIMGTLFRMMKSFRHSRLTE